MQKQNHLLIGLAAASLLTLSATAGAAVNGSLHDLSTTATAAVKNVCVYCHTPHAASNTVTAAPLWNKAAGSAPFTPYTNAATLDGTADITGSVSLACLSCHDGSQAVDSVINAPGTDGYVATGLSNPVDPAAARGVMAAGVANLGGDLSNDHPVSIEYAGTAGLVYGTAYSTPATDFATGDTQFNPITVNAAGTKSFADDGINTLPLYTKSTGGTFVECATCHDPHDQGTGLTFLRVSNAGSAVCVTCHVK